MNNFPFEDVHQYMVDKNWLWAFLINEDGAYGRVPTVEDLKETAVHLLLMVADSPKPFNSIRTGGFVADKFTWDSSVEYRLSFTPFLKTKNYRIIKE